MKKDDDNMKKLASHDKKSFIKILSSLAAVEGSFDEEENEFLANIASEWGITAEELLQINTQHESSKISIPEDETERIDQLAALIGMMMVDGKIFDEEIQFCSMVAKKFGFKPGIVNDIITDIFDKN